MHRRNPFFGVEDRYTRVIWHSGVCFLAEMCNFYLFDFISFDIGLHMVFRCWIGVGIDIGLDHVSD